MAAAFADERSAADMNSSFVSAGSASPPSSLAPSPPPPPSSSGLPWASTEDATMRNALAFLAQKDSESALVYALVHDPEFRLATALTSNAQRIVDVGVVRALLQLFDAYEDQLRRFVAMLMLREMVDTLNWNELFRANSATTAIIREYTCDLGLEFLQSAFQEELAQLWDLPEAYEVNPRLVASPDALVRNRQQLEALATRLLTRIVDAAPLFPYQIAKIYRVLEAEMTRLIDRDRKSSVSLQRLSARLSGDDANATDADAFRRSNASLPRLSAISEDRFSADEGRGSATGACGALRLTATGLPTAKEEFYVHLGGFLFLRFLCPALLLPHQMGLTPDGHAPSKPLQRTLVLVAKLFQSLANNVEYGAREEYMTPFNGFLAAHRAKLFAFYDQICQQAQNDNRRESLILRSNLAPRISQLWTPNPASTNAAVARASSVSSSASGAGYGLLGNSPLVASADEALGVVQQWITTHLDSLVAEVATHGGKAKRKHQAPAAVDQESTPLRGSMSPPKKKKAVPIAKHKLKSSKTLSPVPTLGAMGDEDEDEEEKEEKEEKEAGQNKEEEEGKKDLTENVAKEDLERVLGHTIHRDIQLMKIYYASLSQAGLQRLLRVNSEDAAHEWTLHKSRHSVDVFRRDDPSAHGCGGVLSTRTSPFVEMKAFVEINSTPRQVFKYLRSLEKMTEWDDRTASVRRVEPLDDSKVVLYRSRPKLSFWPSWLVKPRDSCDLHSFVGPSKTGRADTYAVLLESVPRPDVPTVKGTVRMSFATGGFLVEPGPVSETYGQTTKLTCVVNADFKGALPRVLAESICVRHVLSVRAVKLRLETALQHGQSTWI